MKVIKKTFSVILTKSDLIKSKIINMEVLDQAEIEDMKTAKRLLGIIEENPNCLIIYDSYKNNSFLKSGIL